VRAHPAHLSVHMLVGSMWNPVTFIVLFKRKSHPGGGFYPM